jgi:2,4-dienoyl-CoA reductase-like NADH-dependent reductase (Old Yellow Enzyme family)
VLCEAQLSLTEQAAAATSNVVLCLRPSLHHTGPAYQVPFAIKVKKAVGDKLAISVVGMINNAHNANDLLEKAGLDLITIGRGFQKNPGLVFAWAEELGVQIQMPNQVRHPTVSASIGCCKPY